MKSENNIKLTIFHTIIFSIFFIFVILFSYGLGLMTDNINNTNDVINNNNSTYNIITHTVNLKAVDKDNREEIDCRCLIDYKSSDKDVIVYDIEVKKNYTTIVELEEGRLYHFNCWSDNYYFTKISDVMAGVKNINLSLELEKKGKLNLKVDVSNNYLYLNININGKFRKAAICTNEIPLIHQNLIQISIPLRLLNKNLNCYDTQKSFLNENKTYIFNPTTNNIEFYVIDNVRFYNYNYNLFMFGYEDENGKDIGIDDYYIKIKYLY